MVSKPKSTTTRKTGSRARKPATIDLEAKKPADSATATNATEATKSPTKPAASASTEKPAFGRPDTKPAETKTETAKSSASASTTSAATPKKPEKPNETAAPKKSAPEPVKTNKKSGGGLMSGLIGATTAVVGLGAVGQIEGASEIPFIGKLYSGGNTEVTQSLSGEELAALQNQVTALQADNARISELETALSALQAVEPSQGGSGLDPAITAQITQLEAQVADLNEALSAPAASNERLEVLEASIADLASATQASPVDLTAVNETLAGLEGKISELEAIEPVDTSALEGRLAEVETSLAQVSETLTALNDQSSDLRETVASVKASETVARSVAVNALGAALQNDDPVTLAIASVESLGGSGPETQRLSELAREGIPTQSLLLSELSAFTNGVQNPPAQAAEGTLSERFWANAQNLVTFRSSGPQDGTAPIAILSRVKAAIEGGNLTQAKAEWQSLPTETQASGEAWLALLNKRMEAFALYQGLSDKFTSQDG